MTQATQATDHAESAARSRSQAGDRATQTTGTGFADSHYGIAPTAGPMAALGPVPTFGPELAQMLDEGDLGARHRAMTSLQRTTGNRNTAAFVQRWTAPFVTLKSDEQLIKDAIKDRDVTAIKEISDFGKATAAEKISMLGILLGQWILGPRDERAMRSIWSNFGGSLVTTASANIGLWKQSWEKSSGAGRVWLEDLGGAGELKKGFPGAVKALAGAHLTKNESLVNDELAKLGLSADKSKEAADGTPDQTTEMERVREALAQGADAQKARQALRTIHVGYQKVYDPTQGHERDPLGGGERKVDKPMLFTPGTPPSSAPTGKDPVPMQPYQKIQDSWDDLGTVISTLASQNPAVFAVLNRNEGDPEATAKAADDPKAARQMVGDAMRDVLANIAKSRGKLNDDDFLMKLAPVHAQLKGGQGGSGGKDFNTELGKWVIDRRLEEHANQQFWLDLGLTTLAAAAFLVAEFATLGSATFFVAAGVGLAATGTGVAMKWDEALSAAAADKSAASDETRLVSPDQVTPAMTEAIIASALALLMAAGVVVKGLSMLKTGVAAPEINFGKQMSASGFKGTLGARAGFGVFEGRIPGVSRPVAIKVYPESMGEMFARDMAGAEAASRTGIGPKFYGEVPAGPGKRAFAMEKIEGAFPEYLGDDTLSAAAKALGKEEAKAAAARVTDMTVKDMQTYQQSLLSKGYYYDGEVQGLVTTDGHWRAIDFQPVKPLPPVDMAAERAAALARHNDMFKGEIEQLQKLAAKNAQR